VSFAVTANSNVIVGVVSHEHNVFDGHTLPDILRHTAASRGKEVRTAACDRGYRGSKTVGNTQIILPGPPLKRDSRYQRDQKRKRCRRRAAIEPVIGHLKADFRLARNFLKGTGDLINALLAATAWNLKLWLRAFLRFIFDCLDRFPMLSIGRTNQSAKAIVAGFQLKSSY
jgi:IS5 family transposase